jgi:AraC-like DNA-binding protein
MLNMFDLEPIVAGVKVKNVVSFALNENPVRSNPFSVEVGLAMKKKQIHIYTVTEDRMILQKEVSIPEIPVTLGMDGEHICVATQLQYIIVNYETGHVQDLFPYEHENTKPFVIRVSKDEFLVSAPSALGMFATSSGISQRPPLQWSDNLVSVAYSHPYILALNDEFITVHSILDQQQKQSIPFQGGQYLGEFDGRPFVASSKEVYALIPIAIDKQKKPVVQLKAASALNRIMVLCDNSLTMLNMFDLEPIVAGVKVKNVVSFALNENPVRSNPFSVEVGLAMKKKQIHIYTVTEDRMILQKEVSIPEIPVTLGMDGEHICVATQLQYIIVNYETGHVQDLFPYEHENTKPFVIRVSKDEFLVSAPSALGMFATSSGISQRPPLQWSDNLVSVAYSHPYILALNDEFITVHSILDQQQKQSIPFQGGQYLGEFDGRPFVASSKEVYALIPIAIDKQIQALLADQRVSEALDLAKNARKTGLSKERFTKMYQRIQQQAGFIEFQQRNLDQARELFHGGKLDVRELITLYPLLMPAKTTFTRTVPPLHEIADITQISQSNQEKIQQYKMFLLSYLEDMHGTSDAYGCALEIDTALLKLYAETNSGDLVSFIVSSSACDVEDCESWLDKYGHHHAMALLHKYRSDNDKALSIWIRWVPF